MSGPYRLIVTDTPPLFTLVLADALDILLRPDLAVSIPDAVYIETTLLRGAPGAEALLLFEDTDVEKRRAIVDERVGPISTGVFLYALAAAHLIQSADHILDQAAANAQMRSVSGARRKTAHLASGYVGNWCAVIRQGRTADACIGIAAEAAAGGNIVTRARP